MSREEWLEWRQQKREALEKWESLPLVERLNQARNGGLPPEKKRDALEILENSQPVDVRTIELEKSLVQMENSRDYWRVRAIDLGNRLKTHSNLDSDTPFK